MKKTVLLFLFLCFTSLLFSQDYFEHVFTTERHNHLREFAVGETFIAVGGHAGECDRPYIGLLSKDGEELWYDIPLPDFGWVTDIAFEDEATIYGTIRWSQGDDYPSPLDGFYFFRYDTSGTQLALEQFSTAHFGNYPIQRISTGDYLIGVDSFLVQMDELGAVVDFISFPSLNIYDIVPLGDSTFAVSYLETITGTYKKVVSIIDEIGTILNTVESSASSSETIKIAANEDQVFIVVPGEIAYWKPSLDSIDYHPFPNVPNSFEISFSNDYLYSCFIERDDYFGSLLILDKIDMEGNRENIWLEFVARRWFKDFVLIDSTLYLGTNIEFEENSDRNLEAGLMQKISNFTFPNTENLDIGVSALESSNPDLDIFEAWENDGDTLFHGLLHFDVAIEVTNYGSIPVDDFVLSSELIWSFNCGEGRTASRITDADLLPGGTITLNWTHTLDVYFNSGEELAFESCFFTAAPNQQIDTNFGNNSSCSFVTSIDEVVYTSPINIFPNPANDQITISLPEGNQIKQILLFDQSGRQVFADNVESLAHYTLQKQNWPSGLYYLKIQTENGMRVKKVVFQD